MKKLLLGLLIVTAVWGIPRLSHPAVDIGRLEPVEVVRLSRISGGIAVETDSGRIGKGRTLQDAVADLRNSADAEIFLETADKLIATGNLDAYWQEIFRMFRPACQLCAGGGTLDLKDSGRYMELHPAGQTLAKLRAGEKGIPILKMENGRGWYADG